MARSRQALATVERTGNLLYAIVFHQMPNFTVQLVGIDRLTVLAASGVIYVAVAIVIVVLASRVWPTTAGAR